jgi:hypothetical protein
MSGSASIVAQPTPAAGLPHGRAFLVLRLALAAILLAAAIMKSLQPASGTLSERLVPAGQILLECLMAGWLVLGGWPRVLRIASAGLFSIFAIVAGVAVYQGRTSCGCFGRVEVSPVLTLAIDIAAVIALLCIRASSTPQIRFARLWAGLILLAGVVAAAMPIWRQVTAIDAHLHPDAPSDSVIRTESSVADLGYIEEDSMHTVRFALTAPGDTPWPIARVDADCGCTAVVEHPPQLEPGRVAEIVVRFHAPREIAPYRKALWLRSADPAAKPLKLEIAARVGMPLSLAEERIRLDADKTEAFAIVHNASDEPIRLLYATTSDPAVAAFIPREPVPARGSLKIPLRVRGPVPASLREVRIEIQHSHAKQRPLRVIVVR